ncbi:MAG: hypothetical protein IKJ07_00520 [Clostridia bacterium]|nr:hypothetical protein [Clostridia bacterium]
MKKLFSLLAAVAMIISLGSLALLVGADYVPSVEFDDAPIIVTPSVADEDLPDGYDPADEIKGIVTNAEGERTYIPDSKLGVISVSEAHVIGDAEAEYDEALVAASRKVLEIYNGIIDSSVAEVVTGLDSFAASLGFVAPEFSVKNVFDLDAGVDLSAEGDSISIIFKNNMDVVDGGFVVACYVNDAWTIVDASKVVFDGENITVEFDDLCPIVFVAVEETHEDTTTAGVEDTTEDTTAPVIDDEEDKPNNTWIWIVVVFVAVVVAGGVTVYVLWKKGIIRFKK